MASVLTAGLAAAVPFLARQVFVHKIAGAVAEAGGDLAAVAEAAKAAAAQVSSYGVALGTCSVPGQARSARLDGDVIEFGTRRALPGGLLSDGAARRLDADHRDPTHACRLRATAGLGIHGEPGASQSPLLNASEVARRIVAAIMDGAPPPDGHGAEVRCVATGAPPPRPRAPALAVLPFPCRFVPVLAGPPASSRCHLSVQAVEKRGLSGEQPRWLLRH